VAPSTLPSTKALFTGRVWRQRGGTALAADEGVTLAERFRRAGYRTGLFSGSVYVSQAYGTARGFETAPEETLFAHDHELAGSYNDSAARVGRAALAWLDSLPPKARAFLYLHVIHPHNPYQPPPAFAARFAAAGASTIDGSTATLLAVAHQRRAATLADQRRLRALYLANLAYGDAELAGLVTALRRRAPPQELLLVVSADHGEELFDHGGVLHGYTLYEEQLRIPLLLSWPGHLRPQVVHRPTDTRDLHATLAALTGAPAAGRSLWGLVQGTSSAPAASTAADELHLAAAANVRGGVFSARTPRYKVIWAPRTGQQWGQGEGLGRSRDGEYVFDLRADPGERRNLAGLDLPEVLWLRSRLRAWTAAAETADGETAPADAETRARLRALGYVE
jgi:arylsulfatase A-like enzyme